MYIYIYNFYNTISIYKIIIFKLSINVTIKIIKSLFKKIVKLSNNRVLYNLL